jgi:hypothetical protein
MATFVHIFIKPKSGVTSEMVERTINLGVDWYRYSDYCWIVKTTSTVEKWQTRLKPLVEPGGTLLIMAVDPTKRQGWIAKSFWEWLKKNDVNSA